MDSVTGLPLRKATVKTSEGVFTTGADGRFPLPKAESAITVLRAGYADGEVPAMKAQAAGVVKLTPYATLRGKALDEDGDPLPDGTVFVYQRKPSGEFLRMALYSVMANGEFVVDRLLPGEYALRVAAVRSAAQPGYWRPALFYPGVRSLAAATVLDVKAGAQLDGFDVRLPLEQSFRLEGRVNSAQAEVTLVEEGFDGLLNEGQTVLARDGLFFFENVPPRDYRLIARDGDKGLIVQLPVSGDVIGLRLDMFSMPRLQVEGDPECVEGITLKARTGPGVERLVERSGDGEPLLRGDYSLTVRARPECRITDVLMNGRPLRGLLYFESYSTVTVETTRELGEIVGLVPRGAGSTVSIKTVPGESWHEEFTTTVDREGLFRIKVAPGEYWVALSEEVNAVRVKVQAGAITSLELKPPY